MAPEQPTRDPDATRRRYRILVAIAAAALAVVLVMLIIRYGHTLWTTFRSPVLLRARIDRWGAWAPLGFVLLQVMQIIVAPLPGNMVAIVGGYAFGFWLGLALCMGGVVLGAACAFLLSKLIGRRALSIVIKPDMMAKFDSFAALRGPFYIFLLLLVPNPIGDWVYYLAGLSVIPLPVFLLLTLVGRFPTNLVEVFIGVQIYRLGATGYHLTWWQWTLFIAVLAAFALVYYVNRKRIEAFFMRFVKFPVGDR
jgi:uncharacterized membrane protein YdjX (TVP38/TMEM64 family)